jgi:hypothetical protein
MVSDIGISPWFPVVMAGLVASVVVVSLTLILVDEFRDYKIKSAPERRWFDSYRDPKYEIRYPLYEQGYSLYPCGEDCYTLIPRMKGGLFLHIWRGGQQRELQAEFILQLQDGKWRVFTRRGRRKLAPVSPEEFRETMERATKSAYSDR